MIFKVFDYNRNMIITRLGGLDVAQSRFADLISREEFSKINIIVTPGENSDELQKIVKEENLISKVEIVHWQYNKYLAFLTTKFTFFEYNVFSLTKYTFADKILNFKHILKFVTEADVIWIGDNDYDRSNEYVNLIKKFAPNKKIIRSYKETRFFKKKSEELALQNADWLIFPNTGYIEFFKNLYGFDLKSKASFVDLDLRYSKLIDKIYLQNVTKFSELDNKLHICILTGVAIWNKNETRAASRYYYLDLINELYENGFVVHLHTGSIVKDRNFFRTLLKIRSGSDNPYEKLAKEGKLIIEKKLHLNIWSSDYLILKKYDGGILHTDIASNRNDVKIFQDINIPNRIYEYYIAQVPPIIKKGSAKEIENLIKQTKLGFIYEDYKDLKLNLKKAKPIPKYNKSYADFSKEFLKVCSKWKTKF
jgi:hypothetical protein